MYYLPRQASILKHNWAKNQTPSITTLIIVHKYTYFVSLPYAVLFTGYLTLIPSIPHLCQSNLLNIINLETFTSTTVCLQRLHHDTVICVWSGSACHRLSLSGCHHMVAHMFQNKYFKFQFCFNSIQILFFRFKIHTCIILLYCP